MEVDGIPAAQVTESVINKCETPKVERHLNSAEEEIWNLLRRAEDRRVDTTIESKNTDEVPREVALTFGNPTEGRSESESIGQSDNHDDAQLQNRQAFQQEQPQEPAEPQPQQPGQGEPEEQQQEPEPNLPPFLVANENRPDEDEIADLQNRLSTLIIAQALAQYRAQGVPEDDLEVILIPHTAGGTFLSRGAWFGSFVLLSVLVLFLLQMQAMVGFISKPVDITFDELMYELLDVRRFDTHVQHCHKDKSSTMMHEEEEEDSMLLSSSNPFSTIGGGDAECSSGVLHIPALQVLRDEYPLTNRLMPHRQGINLTWRMPCQTPNRALLQRQNESCSASEETGGVCTMEDNTSMMCFRGVHDKIVSVMDVGDSLRFARELIRERNDHFDVFLAGTRLEEKLPGLVNKLRVLLADVYSVHQIEPFAFRMLSVGPMDGYGVDQRNWFLNRTNYKRWVKSNKMINDRAKPSIPWPFRWEPVRDQCLLLSDMEADPKFSIYTTVFLTTGAGYDFRGGTTLFVDDDDSTLGSNRRSKIQRGLVIDGSEGRVVVSTGGLENRRCRLPLREGVRTELQIWWDTNSTSSSSDVG